MLGASFGPTSSLRMRPVPDSLLCSNIQDTPLLAKMVLLQLSFPMLLS